MTTRRAIFITTEADDTFTLELIMRGHRISRTNYANQDEAIVEARRISDAYPAMPIFLD